MALSREDCLELYRKYNCTPSRFTLQLCQDLSLCIHQPDSKHCIINLIDDTGPADNLEGIEELLENIGLALGGTTIGAYFANFIHIRHLFKPLYLVIVLSFMKIVNRIKPKRGKEAQR